MSLQHLNNSCLGVNLGAGIGQSFNDTCQEESIKGSQFVWLGVRIAHREIGDKLLEKMTVSIKYTISKGIIGS